MARAASTNYTGIAVAVTIIVGWTAWLTAMLAVDLIGISAWLIVPSVAVQTFLYTGLFITAHDAMHGAVAPSNRRLNDFIGALAVRLYALFSYDRLIDQHRNHHQQPATDDDPDYHDGRHRGFWRWYLHFVGQYIGVAQIIGMAIVYNALHHLVGVDLMKLNLFWVLPSVLSTVQLFYFGTYLPHRRPPDGYADRHRSTTNAYGKWLSFLTCYHFGYHWEHHEKPGLPWWKLPQFRRQRRSDHE